MTLEVLAVRLQPYRYVRMQNKSGVLQAQLGDLNRLQGQAQGVLRTQFMMARKVETELAERVRSYESVIADLRTKNEENVEIDLSPQISQLRETTQLLQFFIDESNASYKALEAECRLDNPEFTPAASAPTEELTEPNGISTAESTPLEAVSVGDTSQLESISPDEGSDRTED